MGHTFGWADADSDIQSARHTLRELNAFWVEAKPDEGETSTNATAPDKAASANPIPSEAARPTLALADRYSSVLDAGHQIAAAVNLEEILNATRKAAVTLLRGDRCTILMRASSGEFCPYHHELSPNSIDAAFSHSLLKRVLEAQHPMIISNAMPEDGDANISSSESYVFAGFRSAICAPISVANEVLGCFMVTHQLVDGLFEEEDQRLAQFIATVAGASLERLQAHQTILLETEQKAALHKELEVARAVQQNLFPSSELKMFSGLEVAGICLPAASCGGDFWAVYSLNEHCTLFIIADVTGHGVPPALVTATVKGCCDSFLRSTPPDAITAQGMLKALNDVLFDPLRSADLLMTCKAMLVDTKKHVLSVANAGHCPLYMLKQSHGGPKVESISVPSYMIGEKVESTFVAIHKEILSGDVLLLYSDGIIEGCNPNGNMFRERRLRNAFASFDTEMQADEMRDRILERAFEFYADVEPDDDITLVVCKIR